MRLIGAGQKRYFEIHTFGSNSPPHPGKVKFRTPGMAFQIKFPTPRAKKTFKCPGFARVGGGGGGWDVDVPTDRRIPVQTKDQVALSDILLVCDKVQMSSLDFSYNNVINI